MTWGLVLTVIFYGMIFPESLLPVWLTGLTYAGMVEWREWDLQRAIKKKDQWRISMIVEGDMTLRALYRYLLEKQ